jgi:hypothetical protein
MPESSSEKEKSIVTRSAEVNNDNICCIIGLDTVVLERKETKTKQRTKWLRNQRATIRLQHRRQRLAPMASGK